MYIIQDARLMFGEIIYEYASQNVKTVSISNSLFSWT